MIAFIPSLQLTDVSNVAIIIATGPSFAAALAWIWLREIPASANHAGEHRGALRRHDHRRRRTRRLRHSRRCPRLLHGAGDRGDDRHGTAAPEYIDGRGRRDVELSGQRYQHSLRPRNNGDNRLRPAHSRDVRMLSGRPRPHAVLPRLAPAAVRPGGADLHAGDAADAVLDMGGICRSPHAAGARRRRPGDGRRHCRHHRRYQDAAAVRLSAPRTAPDTAGRTARR